MIGFPKGFVFMTLPAFAGGELVVVFESEAVSECSKLKLNSPGNLFLAESPGPKDWSPIQLIPKDWTLITKVPTGLQVLTTVAYLNIEGFSVLLHHVFTVTKKHALYFVPI